MKLVLSIGTSAINLTVTKLNECEKLHVYCFEVLISSALTTAFLIA